MQHQGDLRVLQASLQLAAAMAVALMVMVRLLVLAVAEVARLSIITYQACRADLEFLVKAILVVILLVAQDLHMALLLAEEVEQEQLHQTRMVVLVHLLLPVHLLVVVVVRHGNRVAQYLVQLLPVEVAQTAVLVL
jgi:hypothetical protein